MFCESFNKLKKYVENENFKGWDPFDGLNSIFFQKSFLKNNRLLKLLWLQFFKRSPINLRKIFLVKKDYNPKALGLFLSSYCNLYRIEQKKDYYDKINFFIDKLFLLKSKGWSGDCWGYNFDWQARAFFQPKFTPTVVATTFIVNGLLDAYEILKAENLIKSARSACEFILKDLNRFYEGETFCFSYSPHDKSQIFNASLLGARLLSRVYFYTKEKELIIEAKKTVTYCCNNQNPDGSWKYGSLPFHQWIDSFHTGYNLECIFDYKKYSGDDFFKSNIKKGLYYYLNNFFTEDGIPKYYNNKINPIDIHCSAQLIVTLYKLKVFNKYKELIDKVLNWTVSNMQSKDGYFYYQKNKYFTNKIPYMRWTQAWIFYALSLYLYAEKENNAY
jgi:hypothetical protein